MTSLVCTIKRKRKSAILSFNINKKLKTHKQIPEKEDRECACARSTQINIFIESESVIARSIKCCRKEKKNNITSCSS